MFFRTLLRSVYCLLLEKYIFFNWVWFLTKYKSLFFLNLVIFFNSAFVFWFYSIWFDFDSIRFDSIRYNSIWFEYIQELEESGILDPADMEGEESK